MAILSAFSKYEDDEFQELKQDKSIIIYFKQVEKAVQEYWDNQKSKRK